MKALSGHHKFIPARNILNQITDYKTNRIGSLFGKFLYWLPRLLGFSISIVMAIFALGAINNGGTLFETGYALMVQFIPVAFVAFVLIFAWEWDLVGAVAFFGLAIVELIWGFKFYALINYGIISAIFLVLGILFFFNWMYTHFRSK